MEICYPMLNVRGLGYFCFHRCRSLELSMQYIQELAEGVGIAPSSTGDCSFFVFTLRIVVLCEKLDCPSELFIGSIEFRVRCFELGVLVV